MVSACSASATAVATPPPIECPTSAARRTPSASSAARTAAACPSAPYAWAARGASEPPCPTRSMAITRRPVAAASASATGSHHWIDAE